MNKFLEIFSSETSSTIEGLTGKTPVIGEANEFEARVQTGINPPLVSALINAGEGKMKICATPLLVTAINDLMLGEEKPTMNEEITNDEIDACKEIYSNILGAVSTALGAQNDLPKLSFEIENIAFIAQNEPLNLSEFDKIFVYSVSFDGIMQHLAIAVDRAFLRAIDPSSG